MNQKPKIIFRPEAMAKFMDTQSTPVFPKLIGPGLFQKLWVTVLVLISGLAFLGWVPIAQTYRAAGQCAATSEIGPTLTVLLEDRNGLRIEPRDHITWACGESSLGQGSVIAISDPIPNSTILASTFPRLSPSPDLAWPIRVMTAVANLPNTLPAGGADLQITFERPPKRFLDWLPTTAGTPR